jgi:hypothetical protein
MIPMQVYNTSFKHWMETGPTPPPHGSLAARRRHFLALMVGAPEFFGSTSQGGPLSMIASVDGGCSRISSSGTSQGASHRHFTALMVGAHGPLAPAPAPRGAHRQRFTTLMVGAPGPPALAPPPRGRSSMFYSIDGGHSQTSSSDTSQGGPSSTFYSVDGGRSRTSSYGTASKGSIVNVL